MENPLVTKTGGDQYYSIQSKFEWCGIAHVISKQCYSN